MPVAYKWSLLEDAPNIDKKEEIDDDNERKRKKINKKKHLPINEVFDILPVAASYSSDRQKTLNSPSTLEMVSTTKTWLL